MPWASSMSCTNHMRACLSTWLYILKDFLIRESYFFFRPWSLDFFQTIKCVYWKGQTNFSVFQFFDFSNFYQNILFVTYEQPQDTWYFLEFKCIILQSLAIDFIFFRSVLCHVNNHNYSFFHCRNGSTKIVIWCSMIYSIMEYWNLNKWGNFSSNVLQVFKASRLTFYFW